MGGSLLTSGSVASEAVSRPAIRVRRPDNPTARLQALDVLRVMPSVRRSVQAPDILLIAIYRSARALWVSPWRCSSSFRRCGSAIGGSPRTPTRAGRGAPSMSDLDRPWTAQQSEDHLPANISLRSRGFPLLPVAAISSATRQIYMDPSTDGMAYFLVIARFLWSG